MDQAGRAGLPPNTSGIPQLAGLNQELADAFSAAVFGLLEHNCSCPSAKFVRLLVAKRKDIFKGGEAIGQGINIAADRPSDLSDTG